MTVGQATTIITGRASVLIRGEGEAAYRYGGNCISMTGHKAIQLAASRSKARQPSGRNASGPREVLDFPRELLWKAPSDRCFTSPLPTFVSQSQILHSNSILTHVDSPLCNSRMIKSNQFVCKE